MKTFKRLGLTLKRDEEMKGWRVIDRSGETIHRSQGNKGQVMDACLREAHNPVRGCNYFTFSRTGEWVWNDTNS